MIGEIIGEAFLRVVFEIIIQVVGYYTSRIIFPIISFGRISVAPAGKGVKVKPKWHGFNSASNGKIVIHEETGALLGLLFWAGIIVIAFIVYSNK